MKYFALLMFLHISQAYVKLEKCLIDYRSLENAWEQRLNSMLLCNYDGEMPPKPRNGSDCIDVTLHFVMKSFQYVSELQEFSAYMLSYISWEDERLKWNPNDYGGIDETIRSSDQLWLPGIKLYNSISDIYDQSHAGVMSCRISSHGFIQCGSWITFESKCANDLKDWPFDTQVCSFEFGPWVHEQGPKVRLEFSNQAIVFIGSEYGAEWDIMDYTQEENQNELRQLKMYFTLVRHAKVLAAIVIYPSILLSILTFAALFLDVRCDSRLYVACFSLMCHFFFLSELGWLIPSHSKYPPRILFYFRGSVIMTTNSIILTYVLKLICERKTIVPDYIAIANEYVYKKYCKLVIRPRWGIANDDDDKSEFVKAWTDFANLLNSIWIFVSMIVYIVMCYVFIPIPSGIEQHIRVMSYDFD